MTNVLIAIPLASSLILLSVFAFFSAFHYCERKEPERIFIIGLGVFTVIMAVFVTIGLLTAEL